MIFFLDDSGSGGGGSALHELILEDATATSGAYFRLNDAALSTSAANSGAGGSGSYSGSGTYSLGNPAIYLGGPSSFRMESSSGHMRWGGAGVPDMNSMTIGVVWKIAGSGISMIITRDTDSSGSRFFQFRQSANSLSLEFIKIVGSVQTVSFPHGLSTGDTALVVATVSTSGLVKIFVNGSKIGQSSVSAANYGGVNSTPFLLGNRYMQSEGKTGTEFSELFLFPAELSESRIAQYGAAAGL